MKKKKKKKKKKQIDITIPKRASARRVWLQADLWLTQIVGVRRR
jgi:hypothetical protein